jgi:formylglycine-generating enzyme required for sulfatase activity
MKNPAAFISYARRDDAAYGGRITGLRERLQRMVAAAIGRDFEIFQDCEGIAWGQHWRSRLDEALDEGLFLIPILTPSYFNSEACRAELETFLELERRSGRKDRILSLYFLHAPVYEQRTDPLVGILHERQHRDWRHLRIDPLGSAKVMRALDSLARELADAIHARQEDASPPAKVPDSLARSPAAQTMPVPSEAKPGIETSNAKTKGEEPALAKTPGGGKVIDLMDALRRSLLEAPPPASKRTRIGPSRKPDTVSRDIDAQWCPELVMIPAGSFVMGAPEAEEGRSPNEGPQHEVRFTQPFALGRYPVTFEEYDHFCSDVGREKPGDGGWGRGRRPAINVSWQDATVYCAWLSEVTGQRYGLPSEAEWEYACRAGTNTPFWTGATISTRQANYNGNYTYGLGHVGKYRKQTMPVDTFEANPWGLHDMHGNVWQWVEDCWNDSYEGAPNDGSSWTSGDCGRRVLRGGCWNERPKLLRSGIRIRDLTGLRVNHVGFRVARTLTVDFRERLGIEPEEASRERAP